MLQSVSLGTAVLVLVTLGSGAITLNSVIRCFMHGVRSHVVAFRIVEKLRPSPTFWKLMLNVMREPLLPLSAEAAHLGEAGDLLDAQRKNWKHGLLALGAGIIFCPALLFLLMDLQLF